MRLVVAGDVMASESLQEGRGPHARAWVEHVLSRADVAFGNFESVVHDYEWPPMSPSGGTWTRTPPTVCAELREIGFTVMSLANNHAGDYGWPALRNTMHVLEAAGIVHAGAGPDSTSAVRPRYHDTPAGRIALIATTSTVPPHVIATDAHPPLKARPGVHHLRHRMGHEVPADVFAALHRTLGEFGNPARANHLAIAGIPFTRGSRFRREEHLDDSFDALLAAVRQAREAADLVLVSIHSHEHTYDPSLPAAFLVEACHRLVDAGADLIAGHGPHRLRPVEIYRGKPILYGLGSLLVQTHTGPVQPPESFVALDVPPGDTAGLLHARYRHCSGDPESWITALAEIDAHDGEITGLRLVPALVSVDPGSEDFGLPVPITQPLDIGAPDAPPTLSRVRRILERMGARAAVEPDEGNLPSRTRSLRVDLAPDRTPHAETAGRWDPGSW